MNSHQITDKKSIIRQTGAVYTPPVIAASLIAFVKNVLPEHPLNILEPSVGDGVFLNELTHLVKSQEKQRLTVIDIDQDVVDNLKLRTAVEAKLVNFISDDYINFASPLIKKGAKSFDLVIGNPPFIRKHNFSESFKETLKDFATISEYPLQQLKNSWAAFLIASSRIVSDDGVVALILPYELMTASYGKNALQSLISKFERIDIFVSKERAFPQIDQDAVIFIGQKKCRSEKGVFLNKIKCMSDLSHATSHKITLSDTSNNSLELNSFLVPSATLVLLKRLRETCSTIEDYASSAPGIVSGANDFFILKKSKAQELGVETHTIPILKKGSFASHNPIFQVGDFSELEKSEPCYLLRIKGEFESLEGEVQSYIREGETKQNHLGYKCRNRRNWYEVTIVPREQGFIFKRSHSYPRLCLNEANVYLTDTAYGIRLRDGFTMRGVCYSFYNSLTLLFAETDGRFYGGGVLELSPSEFRGLPLVYHEPTEEEFASFLDVHAKAEGDVDQILDFGDIWLQSKLSLSEEQAGTIRQAWEAVRAHRMRHGGRNVSS